MPSGISTVLPILTVDSASSTGMEPYQDAMAALDKLAAARRKRNEARRAACALTGLKKKLLEENVLAAAELSVRSDLTTTRRVHDRYWKSRGEKADYVVSGSLSWEKVD